MVRGHKVDRLDDFYRSMILMKELNTYISAGITCYAADLVCLVLGHSSVLGSAERNWPQGHSDWLCNASPEAAPGRRRDAWTREDWRGLWSP